MKLSIIIPAYNVADYIEDCILNVYEQSLHVENFEIIVIDDGSVDQTLDICKRLAGKYGNLCVFSQSNQGQSVARNKGLSLAKGEFIFFMDSDDLLRSDSLGFIVNYMEKNHVDFFGFGFEESSDRKLFKEGFNGDLNVLAKGTGIEIIGTHEYYNGPCWFVFKRSLIDNLRFIPGIYCEDALFTPRLLLLAKSCIVVSNPLYLYYSNSNSTLRHKSIERNIKMFNDMFFVADDFNDIINFPEASIAAKTTLLKRQQSFVFYGIIRFLRTGQSVEVLNRKLESLLARNAQIYPLKYFKGSGVVEGFLLNIINNRFGLKLLTYLNNKIKIIS